MTEFRIERWNNIYAPNGAMLRFTMEREGYRVYQWGDMPGAVYGLRKHAQAQSRWIISGTLEITIERREPYTLQAGDRDFMPANLWYSMHILGEENEEQDDDETPDKDGEPDEPKPVIYFIGEKIK